MFMLQQATHAIRTCNDDIPALAAVCHILLLQAATGGALFMQPGVISCCCKCTHHDDISVDDVFLMRPVLKVGLHVPDSTLLESQVQRNYVVQRNESVISNIFGALLQQQRFGAPWEPSHQALNI